MGWVYNATTQAEAESQYGVILGVCLSLTILMVITVCLRLYVRTQARRLAAADYVMIGSMIFSIIYSALCIAREPLSSSYPASFARLTKLIVSRKSIWTRIAAQAAAQARPFDLYPMQTNSSTQLNYAGRPFYQIGIAGFKASLCLSYLRLLDGTSKAIYRIIIWIVIAISTLGHIAGALVLIFNCQPVERAWNPKVPGTCLPVGGTFYSLAIFTIVCDVLIIFLPIPLLLRLNIKTAQKAGVVCLFLLGLFTTICSILRLTQINRVAFGDGNSTMLVLWGTIEFNVGNIVTCIPYLAPLLKGVVRDFRSNSGRLKYYSNWNSRGRSYAMDHMSKDQRSHLQSSASGPTHPKRTPSEELILSSREPEHGGIEMTVEYSVSLENGSTRGSRA
ncbi:hypothetical protein NUU61_003944 [Penicillium alfredii]|uniref:Rhodopsin domain-containing protein n=1 Tax=Penicillium alfredii TaxID=1506179 RepID=A0A9W9FKQ6_9EURO|nr:uncharacterized protein NUU61_003944 [Penicillium alfredii]KAJ5101722.1 hypothetical protein NUU61_003944 [Penicillium alfredii]